MTQDNPQKLVGQGGEYADALAAAQGTAAQHGFAHVSSKWYPKTISYDDALNQIECERRQREDIMFDAQLVSFGLNGNCDLSVVIGDREFCPTEHAARQLCNWFGVPGTMLTHYHYGEAHDEGGMQVLLHAFRDAQRRTFQGAKTLRFRTYSDGTLRAILSEKYSCVDNRAYLELMRELIPGGRCSHWRGDADTLYGRILIPDTIRTEDDSDYGGAIGVSNCEIGKRTLGSSPELFRFICMNGCVHGETKGKAYKQRHIGIVADAWKEDIRRNLDAQIPLITTGIPLLLATHGMVADSPMVNIFAAVAKANQFDQGQATELVKQFTNHSNEKSAFGTIDALTRASQTFDPADQFRADTFAGQLLDSANWARLNSAARGLSEKDVNKVFGVAV